MNVQAELSLYPLRQPDLAGLIREFLANLDDERLTIETGTMSTRVVGNSQLVFNRIQQAFEGIADHCDVVMALKVSNACPETQKGKMRQ